MSISSAADSYGLTVPQEWIDVPVEREALAERAAEIKAQLRADGVGEVELRRLDLLVSQVANDLALDRVQMAAVWPVSLEGEDDDAASFLFAALCVSTLRSDDLGSPGLRLTTDRLIAGLQLPEDGIEDAVDLAPPLEVSLEHAGRAVKLTRLYERRLNVVDRVRTYAVSYLVPHDAGAAVCLLQFTTPNVEDASLLEPLFEGIAQTLRIFKPGDPTDFGESPSQVDDA